MLAAYDEQRVLGPRQCDVHSSLISEETDHLSIVVIHVLTLWVHGSDTREYYDVFFATLEWVNSINLNHFIFEMKLPLVWSLWRDKLFDFIFQLFDLGTIWSNNTYCSTHLFLELFDARIIYALKLFVFFDFVIDSCFDSIENFDDKVWFHSICFRAFSILFLWTNDVVKL